jgi:trans-2,3-dihydro-3-hydroxyanthranilate isomerase
LSPKTFRGSIAVRRKFHTIDVFTDVALAGNPLAVVLDSDGLDTARMQAIAREFNVSETVFLQTPQDPVNTAKMRIFTPRRELPFAGHPTVGTAILLGELRAPDLLAREDVRIVLEEAVGPVVCTVRHLKDRAPRASFALPQLPSLIDDLGAAEDIAVALGLTPADLAIGAHHPARFSAGVPFAFVPLAGKSAVERVQPDLNYWQAAFGGKGREPVYVYCSQTVHREHAYHARMFAPDMGLFEDPATGGAVAALAGVITRDFHFDDGNHTLIIEQGFAMGRPSLITLGLEIAGGALRSASIGGAAVLVTNGTIDV